MGLIEVGAQRRLRRRRQPRRSTAASRPTDPGDHAHRTGHRSRRRYDGVPSAGGRDQRNLADQFVNFGTQSDRDFALDGVQIGSGGRPADAGRVAGTGAAVAARAQRRRFGRDVVAPAAAAADDDVTFDGRMARRGRRAVSVARASATATRQRIDGGCRCRRNRISDDWRRRRTDKAKNIAPERFHVTGCLQLGAPPILAKLVSATNDISPVQ